jgi:acyl-CoA synthetase (AMP-forming)/AMP-acid ligase II
MMCANATMLMQARDIDAPPEQATYLDWLPWNHVMGGNAVFNLVLSRGASLYIDDGKPVPGQFEKTLRNLREVSPITYSNAPAGYIALATALEQDEPLRNSFSRTCIRLLTVAHAFPMISSIDFRSWRCRRWVSGSRLFQLMVPQRWPPPRPRRTGLPNALD